jgi:phosphoglycerate dehydrogenase-like enzyme
VNKLLILSSDAPEYGSLVADAGLPHLEVTLAMDIESAAAQLAGCNIILGSPQLVADVLGLAESLEWVQSSWAGVNLLCSPDLRRDYVLTGVKDVFGPPMSEYVFTYLFAFERRVFSMKSDQTERRWKPLPYRPASEISLGIVGLGSIGRHLARTAREFGIRVTGMNRSGKPCDDVDRVYTLESRADFFAGLDYVVLILPDTPETGDFINAETLAMMKETTVLINVGRGNAVNERDLVRALRQGDIGGAVLDVFVEEPLDQDSPLWALPNVFVTPHNAATSFPKHIAGIFTENYRRFLRNEPLLYKVDFELGY